MIVINTRPAGRREPLTQALEQAGHTVLELPLLTLQPLPVDVNAITATMQAQDIVVVVSPMAAGKMLEALQFRLVLSRFRWIAVGAGTARLLRQAGLCVSCPALETSEGLLALPHFQALPSRIRPAVWVMRGRGGRRLLSDELTAQGWPVHSIEWYERQCPQWQWDAVANQIEQADVLLISSGESWQNWLSLTADHQNVAPKRILALGERVCQLIDNHFALTKTDARIQPEPRCQIYRIDDLQPDTVLQALAAFC